MQVSTEKAAEVELFRFKRAEQGSKEQQEHEEEDEKDWVYTQQRSVTPAAAALGAPCPAVLLSGTPQQGGKGAPNAAAAGVTLLCCSVGCSLPCCAPERDTATRWERSTQRCSCWRDAPLLQRWVLLALLCS